MNTTNVQSQDSKLSLKDQAAKLRELASKPVFSAFFHILAMRERSRNRITVNSLKATFLREGFHHSKDECKEVLKELAAIHLGRLDLNRSGHIRALVNIKMPLMRIGKLGLSQDEANAEPSDAISTDARPKKERVIRRRAIDVAESKIKQQSGRMKALITVDINGRDQIFQIPKGVSMAELLTFIQLPVKKS